MVIRSRSMVQQHLETAFSKRQAEVLAEVIDVAYNNLVKVSDFNELKAVVQDLAEAQKRTEVRVEELAEAQKRTEIRIEELTISQRELAEAQKEMVEQQKKMQNSQAEMRGELLEMRYRTRAAAYFGKQLRRVKTFLPSELEDVFEAQLDASAYYDLLQADLVVRGHLRQSPSTPEVWLVIEISGVVDRHDVERAVRRAERLRQAGFPAIAVAAGKDITLGAQTLADELQAVTLLDGGRLTGWEAAAQLALAVPARETFD